MFKILVDTSVWLDLAKDKNQQPLLSSIEELVKEGELSLIVPTIILDEFARNKDRIIQETGRSLSSHFKMVKEVVSKFGDPKKKKTVIDQLNDVDFKIPRLGVSAAESVKRIEVLLIGAQLLKLRDDIKLRAVQRAIEKKAPFHLNKNSINDAILIEIYADMVADKSNVGNRFAFVTHNIKDFSNQHENHKNPHADISNLFSKRKSLYFINLAEAIHRIRPSLVSEKMIEESWFDEPRNLSEIIEAENMLFEKVWYDRHQVFLHRVKSGEHKVVDKIEAGPYLPNTTTREIYNRARKNAKLLEKKHGANSLGPWSDFDWGMINGKLSALRWVLGDEWDNLDS